MRERMLDRAAVERVVRRASALADVDPDALTDRGDVSERALIAAAAEVGIPVPAVRRALAVERLGPPPRHRPGDRIVGEAVVAVDAEVRGSAPDVLARLDAWFVEGHHLRRDRLRGGRGVWSKRKGIVGTTVRNVRFAFGEGRLGRMRHVAVATGATGIGTTMVRVEVDRSHDRRTAAATGTAIAAVASVTAVALAAVTAPVLLAAAPLGLVAGVRVASGGRTHAKVVAAEVDRVLDAVDERAAPIPLRADVTRRVTGRTTQPGVEPGDVSPVADRAFAANDDEVGPKRRRAHRLDEHWQVHRRSSLGG